MARKRSNPNDYQKVLEGVLVTCRANQDSPREWRLSTAMVIALGMGDCKDFEIKVLGLPVDIIPDQPRLMGDKQSYPVAELVITESSPRGDISVEAGGLILSAEDGDEGEEE